MIWVCSIFLLYHLALLVWFSVGALKLSRIGKSDFEKPDFKYPSLAIVVPARNEESTLGTGLNSLKQLRYPDLKIVVVNDRSTDKTGQVLDEFSKMDPRIKPITVQELPSHWLGKNHALQVGAFASQSELILFTDADVEISDRFLSKAVRFLNAHQLDHLAGIPKVTSKSWMLYSFLGLFGLSFSLFTRPWQGKNRKQDRAVGIGAFNLVRRTAYIGIGGHSKLCLRPDDDLKLALVLKRAGFKTDCVPAVDGLSVEWYSSLGEMMRGLEKNVMTGFEYSFSKAVIGNLLFFITFVFPFVMVFLTEGPPWFLSCGSVILLVLCYLGQLKEARMPLSCTPLFPFASSGILFIVARACWLTYRNQGVFWRGTFYSLEELRSNRMDPPGRLRSGITADRSL